MQIAKLKSLYETINAAEPKTEYSIKEVTSLFGYVSPVSLRATIKCGYFTKQIGKKIFPFPRGTKNELPQEYWTREQLLGELEYRINKAPQGLVMKLRSKTEEEKSELLKEVIKTYNLLSRKKLISMDELQKILGLKNRFSLLRYHKKGKLPKPDKDLSTGNSYILFWSGKSIHKFITELS